MTEDEFLQELIDPSLKIETKRLNDRLDFIKSEKTKLLAKKRDLKKETDQTIDRIKQLRSSLKEATDQITSLKQRAWKVDDINVSELRKQVLTAAKKAKTLENKQKKLSN